MKAPTFEADLPMHYQKVFYLNAKRPKTAIWLTLISLIPLIPAIILAVRPPNAVIRVGSVWLLPLIPLAWMAAYVLLLVAHELLHGLAYRLLTGQKLTFGLSWSCAYCGVPGIYVYRRTALIALILPFAVITPVLLLCLWFFRSHPILFDSTLLLLGGHTGGCVGDLYLFVLFLFRYRKREALIQDTGPEQTIYLPAEAPASEPPQETVS